MIILRPRGEMDITTVFGTVVPGSNPGGGTTIYPGKVKKFLIY